mgnify:CR=1 FL=1
MEIRKYSTYKDSRFYLESIGENYSTIFDRLIRLTAKLTESYAGDIYYELSEIEKLIERSQPFDRILCFRECGVNSCWRETVEGYDLRELSTIGESIQTWELVYEPDLDSTVNPKDKLTLERVTIR